MNRTGVPTEVVPVQVAHDGLQVLIPEDNLIVSSLKQMLARESNHIRGGDRRRPVRGTQRVQKSATARDRFDTHIQLDAVQVGKFVQPVFENSCRFRLSVRVQFGREPEDQFFGRRRWRGSLFFEHLSGFFNKASRLWNIRLLRADSGSLVPG